MRGAEVQRLVRAATSCISFQPRRHLGRGRRSPAGLITPIIADADTKSLSAISTRDEGSRRPRQRKQAPAATNIRAAPPASRNMGMFGIKQFEAVINPPQGMIMAIGAGEKRPYIVDDALGDRDGDVGDRQLRPPRDRRRRRRAADAGVQGAGGEPAGAWWRELTVTHALTSCFTSAALAGDASAATHRRYLDEHMRRWPS